MQTQLIGYGQFHLEDFRFGERFCRFDGSIARVCDEQPYRQRQPTCNHPYLPDHLLVWINEGTSNAMKVIVHRRALVHAETPEQARAIEARRRAKVGAS